MRVNILSGYCFKVIFYLSNELQFILFWSPILISVHRKKGIKEISERIDYMYTRFATPTTRHDIYIIKEIHVTTLTDMAHAVLT